MRQTGAFLFLQIDETNNFIDSQTKEKNPKTNHFSDSAFNQRL